METHGRNRDSIADIQENLETVFSEHPSVTSNADGDDCVPVEVLPEIFRALTDMHDGREILSDSDLAQLRNFAEQQPGLLVTPASLVGLLAALTKSSPTDSPELEHDMELRGRNSDRDELEFRPRSSSTDSEGTSYQHSGSRPSSRGPPQTPKNSVFDTHRRQRSTPLGNNAPSSWASRPAPPSRRKSDAGNRSDSESGAFGRSLSRTRSRDPSNPTSPTTGSMSPDLHTSLASPPFRHSSRPASRASQRHQKTPKRSSPYDDHDYSSPDDSHDSTASYDYRGERDDQEFIKSVSTLAMPRSTDSDSEDDDDALGLVMDRSVASSTVSMEQSERLEALQKVNQELSQRAAESDRLLRRRIEEHENEVENYQIKLDELSSELSASKRDEKDLRNKERANTTLISSLEAEIAKTTKALENARSNYASLQKSYQEQCTNSESYRADLRQRDEQIRTLRENQYTQDVESDKYKLASEAYEARIAHLEAELEVAQQVQAQLDEQKQENLLLKETIDRMRFDMDELRNNLTVAQGGSSSGTSSRANTMSKTLGAELANRMKDGWGGDEEEEAAPTEEEEETTVEDGSDGESFVQTIITRKRKVASRANRVETITTHEELKEYSDSSVQYEPALFLKSSAAQTTPPPPPPKVSSFSIQTEPEPVAEPVYITLPPPQRETAEMEIQTDPVEVVEVKEEEEESEIVASSSKQTIEDQPPAYTQITEEHDWQVAADTIKKWHAGVKLPLDAVRGGISPETLADWKAIKEELGVECGVIDKIIAKSGERPPPKDDKGKRRRGRFYNIYNTYVYGAGGEGGVPASGIVAHTAIVVGASALVFLALGPYLGGHPTAPGSATYYDRAAWSSFNTIQAAGEGFMPPDGTATVWNFLGRVGGGAARAARGWPT